MAITNLRNLKFKLRRPQFFPGWIAGVFGVLLWITDQIQRLEWIGSKLPAGWQMPNPVWALVPLLFGAAWLIVMLCIPDNKTPVLRRFPVQMKGHPSAEGMIFTVIPIRNESTTAGLSQLSAFLDYKKGIRGPTVHIHDGVWFDWFPKYGERKLGRAETRELIVGVSWPSDKKPKDDLPPLVIGFQDERKKPDRRSLRERMQQTAWISNGHEITMEDLPPGKWKLRVKVTGIDYKFEFTQKLVSGNVSIMQP